MESQVVESEYSGHDVGYDSVTVDSQARYEGLAAAGEEEVDSAAAKDCDDEEQPAAVVVDVDDDDDDAVEDDVAYSTYAPPVQSVAVEGASDDGQYGDEAYQTYTSEAAAAADAAPVAYMKDYDYEFSGVDVERIDVATDAASPLPVAMETVEVTVVETVDCVRIRNMIISKWYSS